MSELWRAFEKAVIGPGNCTHCGLCAGLCPTVVSMQMSRRGPLPTCSQSLDARTTMQLQAAWAACPGRGVPFPELFAHFFPGRPCTPLLGPYRAIYRGYAADPQVRRQGASGGVISQVLISLLQRHAVGGAVVLCQGLHSPEGAEPCIAHSRDEILRAAQSVYAVTPMLTLLPEMATEARQLAFVGLPDQVAAVRMLQVMGHPSVENIKLIIGPYVGTNMYEGAVRAFLRGHGVSSQTVIKRLEWRAGEWPGHLRVELADGRVFSAEKFYYNYLIPFFIARSCLITPDFANELTDISVGDAWSPTLERQGGGHSVVIARTRQGLEMLDALRHAGELCLEPIGEAAALDMHGHMLDFKKRGTFLRLEMQEKRGLPIPHFGYHLSAAPRARRLVERVIAFYLCIGRMAWARWIVTRLPLSIVGPCFNAIRKSWKAISKPTKRKGLRSLPFLYTGAADRWHELMTSGHDR